MGYCVSEGDFPGGLAKGEVDMEVRRESFYLIGGPEEEYENRAVIVELLFTDVPRLKQLIEYLEEHYLEEPK